MFLLKTDDGIDFRGIFYVDKIQYKAKVEIANIADDIKKQIADEFIAEDFRKGQYLIKCRPIIIENRLYWAHFDDFGNIIKIFNCRKFK